VKALFAPESRFFRRFRPAGDGQTFGQKSARVREFRPPRCIDGTYSEIKHAVNWKVLQKWMKTERFVLPGLGATDR